MNKPSRRVLKIIGISLLTLTGILVIFTTFFLKNIVNNQLKKEIENTFGGFYTLTFDRSATSLSTKGFNIQFEGVNFDSDTGNVAMLAKYPALFFKTDKLQVLEIDIFKILLGAEINTGKVKVEKPELLFYVPDRNQEIDDDSFTSNSNMIESIKLRQIDLIDGKASFVFRKNQNDTLFAGNKLSLHIEDLGFDLLSNANVLNTATMEQMEFSLKDLRMSPLDSEYDYRLDSMYFNYKSERLLCYALSMKPQGNPVQMAAKSQFRKTIFNMEVDSISYQSKDFNAFKRSSTIDGKLLKLMGLRLQLDRNKSVPLDESRYKKLFHESLLALPFHVKMDTIQIENALIDYRVHQRGHSQPGNLLLSAVNGSITQVDTRNKKDIHAHFKGRFMREAPFTFNIELPLEKPKSHTYNGSIGSMSFKGLNPLIGNLTRVRMEEGTLENIEFSGTGRDLLNEGTMKLLYRNLKLSVTDNSNNKRWLQSGIGNLLVRNNNKADQAGEPISIQYTYKRPPFKDHLDLYGGGLIDGFAKGVLPKAIYSLVMGN